MDLTVPGRIWTGGSERPPPSGLARVVLTFQTPRAECHLPLPSVRLAQRRGTYQRRSWRLICPKRASLEPSSSPDCAHSPAALLSFQLPSPRPTASAANPSSVGGAGEPRRSRPTDPPAEVTPAAAGRGMIRPRFSRRKKPKGSERYWCKKETSGGDQSRQAAHSPPWSSKALAPGPQTVPLVKVRSPYQQRWGEDRNHWVWLHDAAWRETPEAPARMPSFAGLMTILLRLPWLR